MGESVDKEALAQHWVHSHEEDSDTEMVFRPASYDFPRSRGRTSFDLSPDGKLIEGGIGPTDRSEKSAGTWQLEAGKLAFYHGSGDKAAKVMQIASASRNRLVVKK